MNPDTTEQNINQAIDWLQKTGSQIQDFATEQAPLYCREVVAWELWSNGIWSAFGLLCLLVGMAGLIKFVQWMKLDFGEPNSRTVPAVIVAVAGMAAGIGMISSCLPRAIKAAVAPRMVIIEHLRNITK